MKFMYGQTKNQGGDATSGQGTRSSQYQPSAAGNRQISSPVEPAEVQRCDQEWNSVTDVPNAGDILLAIYQLPDQWQAGILRIDEVAENSDRDSWRGMVAALELADDHRDCNALNWLENFALSSDQVLYSEVLNCGLTAKQIPTYRKAISRLQMTARMLDLSHNRE